MLTQPSDVNDKVATESSSNSDTDAPLTSSQQDVATDPSPEGGSETSNLSTAADRLEKDFEPAEDTEDSPPPGTEAEVSLEPPATDKADEKVKPETDLSQDAVFNKAFSERPEWKEAIAIAKKAGAESEKAMRKQLRTIYQRETSLASQVEQFKPAVNLRDRIKKCVGDDAGLENSVKLIEGWHAGAPETRQMLVDLIADLDRRTGHVVTSADLKARLDKAKAQHEALEISDEQFQTIEQSVSEVERERAKSKKLESKVQETEQQTASKRQEAQVASRTTALNDWEKTVAKRDADYPRMQKLVTDRALVLAGEQHEKAGRWLSDAEMVKVCDDAYKQIKSELGDLLPKPRSRQPLPQNGGLSDNNRREPTNATQAFDQTVERLEGKRR